MVGLKMVVFIDTYPQLGKEQSDEVCVVIGIFRVLFHKKKKQTQIIFGERKTERQRDY